jgi:hypothetical protein
MNTIPLIFNEKQLQRTILGGAEVLQNVQLPVSAVLLNHSGNQYREQTLDSLLKLGFQSIISVETSGDRYHTEDFSRRFPAVKFILLHEEASDGEMINAAVAEVEAEYFFVFRDSLKIGPQSITPWFFNQSEKNNSLVTVPRLYFHTTLAVPVRFSPVIQHKHFTVHISLENSEGLKTLYPFDFIGLYNRKKFVDLGGFDYTIPAAYWQNLDFALRAWLWGETITLSTRLQLAYDTDPVEVDTSPNASYLRFYLKNIAPVVKGGYGYIPVSTFFSYRKRSRAGFFAAREQFREGRRWVEANRFRYLRDINQFCETWEQNSP